MTRVLPWIEQRPLSSTGLMPFLALLSSASAPSGSGWPISDGSCANAQEFPRWQLPEVWNLHMARLTLPFSLVPWHAEPCLQIIVPSPAGSKYSGRLILLCREHITCEPESGPQLKDSSAKDALLKPLLPPLPSASDGQLPQLSPPLQPQLSSTQLAQLLPLLPAAIPSWMKGHSGPLWHLPCAKNLQSVSEALDMRSLHSDPSLHAKLPSPVSCKHARVLFFPCTEHMASSEPNFPRQPFPVLASAAASSPANSMEVTECAFDAPVRGNLALKPLLASETPVTGVLQAGDPPQLAMHCALCALLHITSALAFAHLAHALGDALLHGRIRRILAPNLAST
eukprot:CAMPEP_0115754614 /NCGR_PEP_ID=MMETSP0272-20121206/96962_1 /TAXON_ID=71861 /ORGANISM="Scrippsiella trochoidea, Strain CCMP3099" /LENGTH=339 /DNA_ID=CAMNT_0003200029 /DNA_START=136 /DNA_END=1151 /DNA_ORIENTATION=+